ncbi:hypothetical protein M405DRAFT_857206 [Rhizopogon salebrosus TDB-379]|nr:hypothetical protein M405DRAFT_857206 [Rhizopogon salebrosus TDB-379]
MTKRTTKIPQMVCPHASSSTPSAPGHSWQRECRFSRTIGPPLRERLSTQSAFFADSVPRSPSGRNIGASTTADSVFDPGSRFPRTP